MCRICSVSDLHCDVHPYIFARAPTPSKNNSARRSGMVIFISL